MDTIYAYLWATAVTFFVLIIYFHVHDLTHIMILNVQMKVIVRLWKQWRLSLSDQCVECLTFIHGNYASLAKWWLEQTFCVQWMTVEQMWSSTCVQVKVDATRTESVICVFSVPFLFFTKYWKFNPVWANVISYSGNQNNWITYGSCGCERILFNFKLNWIWHYIIHCCKSKLFRVYNPFVLIYSLLLTLFSYFNCL